MSVKENITVDYWFWWIDQCDFCVLHDYGIPRIGTKPIRECSFSKLTFFNG